MANTRFQYVKKFETHDTILLNCYFVIRVDGRGFTEFCDLHNFEKPNDLNALKLMNKVAKEVMISFTDIIIAYGESDEYSFGFSKSAKVYNRRKEKILSSVVSCFSSAYVFHWLKYFPKTVLKKVPVFDGRIVLYPDIKNFKDYFAWRQADTHINNLYNTTFWCLVKSGLTKEKAHERLKGSESKDKNEILFTEFKINYNDLPEIYKKGTILIRISGKGNNKKEKAKEEVNTEVKEEDKDNTKDNIVEVEEKESEPKKQLIKVHESLFAKEFWVKYNLETKLN